MPKAFGVLLESELHGGELNQGMGCDLMGLRGPGKEGERSSSRSTLAPLWGPPATLLRDRQVPWVVLGEISPPEPLWRAAWTGLPQVWLLLPSVSCTLHPQAGDVQSPAWVVHRGGPSTTLTFQMFWTKCPLSHSHRW